MVGAPLIVLVVVVVVAAAAFVHAPTKHFSSDSRFFYAATEH